MSIDTETKSPVRRVTSGGIDLPADAGEPLGPVPPKGFTYRILRSIAVHLKEGRWARAHAVLTSIETEIVNELKQPDFKTTSRKARRARFVAELPISIRTVNAIERAELFTVGQVVDSWPSKFEEIPNMGYGSVKEIGLALVAWQLVPLSTLKNWCSLKAGEQISADDLPQIDRLGRPLDPAWE